MKQKIPLDRVVKYYVNESPFLLLSMYGHANILELTSVSAKKNTREKRKTCAKNENQLAHKPLTHILFLEVEVRGSISSGFSQH